MRSALAEIMNEDITKNLYTTPVDNLFKIFIEKFESVLNKHAPLKELSRTEKKFRSKPWLTKKELGILLKPKIHHIKKARNVIHQKAFSDIKCSETV